MINSNFWAAEDAYYNMSKQRMVALVRQGPNKILDIGCGSGKFGEQLFLQDKASEVVGVEIFHPAASRAKTVYSKVVEGDIESMDLNYFEYFDYITCGDILEHLKDPWALIRRAYHWLSAGGTIIVSVPNVRYFETIWNLVARGKWDYVESGILDETHLRFFTKHSLKQLILEGKFCIAQCEMTIHGKKKQMLNKLTFGILQEFIGYQILATGRKPGPNSSPGNRSQ